MILKHFTRYILLLSLLAISLPCYSQEDDLRIEKIINFFAFGTGSTTGTYFPLGNAFAHVWTQKSKSINVMTYSSNGSYENIELLRNHEVNLAIAQSDIVAAALDGKGKFEGRPYKDLKVLMALYPEVIQIVVAESSDIKTLNDLKNHRINVGAVNSGNAVTAVEFLNALNIKEEDYIKVNMSYDEAIQAMEKNECDATIIIAGIPTKVLIEMKKRIPIRIIDIPLQTVAETIQKLPYLSAFTIADDIYGANKNTSTLAVMALLISNTDLKDELAYDLLQILFNNLDYLRIIHERARDLSIKNALRGVKKENLHKGAEKYLLEAKQNNQ
jgi:TRAP transporter TAXI family solute receptor